jgi:AraC-like DNA-binding protein
VPIVSRERALSAPGKRSPSLDPVSTGLYTKPMVLWRLAAGRAVARLEIEEALCAITMPAEQDQLRPSCRDRVIAETIACTIESHFDERLSLADLASAVGVSVFHACRVFHRSMGTSIHQYHREVRLRHAIALLLGTRMPPAQIAAETGFANQGHLGNVFRRRFGVPPGRARLGEI